MQCHCWSWPPWPRRCSRTAIPLRPTFALPLDVDAAAHRRARQCARWAQDLCVAQAGIEDTAVVKAILGAATALAALAEPELDFVHSLCTDVCLELAEDDEVCQHSGCVSTDARQGEAQGEEAECDRDARGVPDRAASAADRGPGLQP